MLIKDLAREEAEEVLDGYWDGSFPVNPVAIALAMGAEVYDADLPPGKSGMISRREGEIAYIFLSDSESPERRRFTCAHEIGHLVDRENRGQGEYSFISERTGKADNPYEWYADHFAGNLLMPEGEVCKLVDWYELSVEELASYFGVSRAAMRLRLKTLGLSAA